jgi:hypothetical protein
MIELIYHGENIAYPNGLGARLPCISFIYLLTHTAEETYKKFVEDLRGNKLDTLQVIKVLDSLASTAEETGRL